MRELILSDSGNEHEVTLTVKLRYHGEKIVDIGQLEANILSVLDTDILPCDEDNFTMEASVDTVAHGSLHDFTKCPYCTGQSSHATEYCAIHGPIGE